MPDGKWNLSPAVLRTLQRRLLFEVDNPLYLLKQRIVNFMYGKYQVKGEVADVSISIRFRISEIRMIRTVINIG